MASAVDLRLDPETHDLVVEAGNFVLLTDPGEVLAQRIRVRLRTFVGEWYLDPSFGTRYRERIFVKPLRRAQAVAELRRVIEGVPGVRRVVSLDADFDGVTRRFTITRGVVESDAGAVEIAG